MRIKQNALLKNKIFRILQNDDQTAFMFKFKKSSLYSPLYEFFLDILQKNNSFIVFSVLVQGMYNLMTAFG